MIYTSSTMLFWFVFYAMGFAIPLMVVYKVLDMGLDILTGLIPRKKT